MCKCIAGSVVCCCCQCAMSVFISLLFVGILLAAAIAAGIYFGVVNVDDSAPELSEYIHKTGDSIKDAVKDKLN
ncbi:AAEL000655-PA [Aedes aegypti]|uniref:AAEL000655-PA n=1 Tax=Aedes aegypti TaxID=7159 RepID=Q17NK8_AEDAE|nr:AAEL000655-PA [Aedes aegypti]